LVAFVRRVFREAMFSLVDQAYISVLSMRALFKKILSGDEKKRQKDLKSLGLINFLLHVRRENDSSP